MTASKVNRDDPRTTSADFLRSIMHDPSLPLSYRLDAAIALLPIEHAQPRPKGKRIAEAPAYTIRIPPLPSAAFARAEERRRARMTLVKGCG